MSMGGERLSEAVYGLGATVGDRHSNHYGGRDDLLEPYIQGTPLEPTEEIQMSLTPPGQNKRENPLEADQGQCRT